MATIEKIISSEIVRKQVIRVTNIDQHNIIILPKFVFSIDIAEGDCPSYKRFLNVNIKRAWVSKEDLVKQIIWGINKQLGENFVQLCKGGDKFNFSLHYNFDPCAKIHVKDAGENYVIFTEKTTTEEKTEYKKLF